MAIRKDTIVDGKIVRGDEQEGVKNGSVNGNLNKNVSEDVIDRVIDEALAGDKELKKKLEKLNEEEERLEEGIENSDLPEEQKGKRKEAVNFFYSLQRESAKLDAFERRIFEDLKRLSESPSSNVRDKVEKLYKSMGKDIEKNREEFKKKENKYIYRKRSFLNAKEMVVRSAASGDISGQAAAQDVMAITKWIFEGLMFAATRKDFLSAIKKRKKMLYELYLETERIKKEEENYFKFKKKNEEDLSGSEIKKKAKKILEKEKKQASQKEETDKVEDKESKVKEVEVDKKTNQGQDKPEVTMAKQEFEMKNVKDVKNVKVGLKDFFNSVIKERMSEFIKKDNEVTRQVEEKLKKIRSKNRSITMRNG